MSRVRRGTFDVGVEILRHKDFTAIPVTLDGTLEADESSVVEVEGRTIVKAGTILAGKTGQLLGGKDVAVVYDAEDETAVPEGVLRYDVDITDGDKEVSMIIRGDIYEDKLPVELISDVREALATRILFIK